MSFVIDGLFIGSLDDVCRKDDLKQKNITHILTIERYSKNLIWSNFEYFCSYFKCLKRFYINKI